MGIIRDSFVIFKNWDNAIRKAPADVQLELYHAVMDYASSGEKPQGLSWQAEMFLESIGVQMESNIAKYTASVENGKKGGNPNFKKGQKNPYYSKTEDNQDISNDNLNITQDNPEITEDNQDITLYEHVHVYDNVHGHVHVNNQSDKKEIEKKNNNACVCVRERFSNFFNYHKNDKFSEKAKLIVNVLEELEKKDNFKFKGKIYTKKHLRERIESFTQEQFEKLISCMAFSEDIENEPLYVTATILS